jgi:hypothetical protein
MKRLVLAGGGHAHVEVLRDLAERPGSGIAVTVVSPRPRLVFTGMIPGAIAGHYRLEDCAIDVEALARRANARFVNGAIFRVDARNHRVHCADGETIDYDILSLDVGSRVAGGRGDRRRRARDARASHGGPDEGVGGHAVRGAGGKNTRGEHRGRRAAGVELALAMEYRLRCEHPQLAAARARDHQHAHDPSGFPPPARAGRLRLQLGRRGIGVHVDANVEAVGADHVRLDLGHRIQVRRDLLGRRALGAALDASSGLAGGSARLPARERDVAVRHRPRHLRRGRLRDTGGPPACARRRLRRARRAGARGEPSRGRAWRRAHAARHEPALPGHHSPPDARSAVGVWGDLSFQGWWAWRWKDRIDRAFVARYDGAAPHRR